MPSPLKVKLLLGNETVHTCQLLVGLQILEERGLIKLLIEYVSDSRAMKSYCACIINDKKIVFEFHDRPGYLNVEQYEWCDFYIKRSITKQMLIEHSKLVAW